MIDYVKLLSSAALKSSCLVKSKRSQIYCFYSINSHPSIYNTAEVFDQLDAVLQIN